MLGLVMASMMVAASEPAPQPVVSLKSAPTRICREMGSAASRSQAIMICRTKAQWQRSAACVGPTTYCTPKQKLAMRAAMTGRESAYPLDDASQIICRKLRITGSRLQSVSTCLSKREWDRMHSDARDEVSELQDNYSKQPRNQ